MPQDVQLSVDPELKQICWPLSNEERILLAVSLRREGCREPIIYWANAPASDNPIVDGHNRHSICTEHGIEYPTKGMTFASKRHVLDWIVRVQLGRRNITEVQRACLRAYLLEQAMDGNDVLAPPPEEPQSDSDGEQDPEPTVEQPKRKRGRPCKSDAIDQVARHEGVSSATIRRDEKYAKALEHLKPRSPILAEAALRDEIDKKDLLKLKKAPDSILRSLEASVGPFLRPAVKAALKRPAPEAVPVAPPKPGTPIKDIRALNDLEANLGVVVRKKTELAKAIKEAQESLANAAKACASDYAEMVRTMVEEIDIGLALDDLRDQLSKVFDTILEWKKEVSG